MLYGISIVFAVLVLLRLVFGEKRVFRIGLTWLNVTKLVCSVCMDAHTCMSAYYALYKLCI